MKQYSSAWKLFVAAYLNERPDMQTGQKVVGQQSPVEPSQIKPLERGCSPLKRSLSLLALSSCLVVASYLGGPLAQGHVPPYPTDPHFADTWQNSRERFSGSLPSSMLVSQAATRGRKVMVVGEDAVPVRLNPLSISTLVERRTLELMHDAPFLVGPDRDLVSSLISKEGPRLYSENASSDGAAPMVSGELVRATFHDGTPVRMLDLKASLLAYVAASGKTMATDYYKGLFDSSSITSPDESNPRAFQIQFKRPVGSTKEALSTKVLPITAFSSPDPTSWPTDSGFNSHPIGAGPFKLMSSNNNSLLSFEAFKEYHKGPPKLNGIDVREVSDSATKLDMLRNKTLHVVVAATHAEQGKFRAAGARIRPYFIRNWWYVGYNLNKPIFQDKAIRKAFSMLINRNALAEVIAGDQITEAKPREEMLPSNVEDDSVASSDSTVTLISGPFVPESPFYNFGVKSLTVDEKGAKALIRSKLKMPGVTYEGDVLMRKSEPLMLKMAVRADLPDANSVANELCQQWKAQGITVRPVLLSPSEWKAQVVDAKGEEAKFSLFLGRYFFDSNGDDVAPIFKTGGLLNFTGYSNPDVDATFARAKTLFGNERAQEMQKIHAAIAEDLPVFALWEAYHVAVLSRNVIAGRIHSFSFYVNPDLWDVR